MSQGLQLQKWRLQPPHRSNLTRFFYFIFFKNIFYKNIFSISQFTVLYPYRPPGGGRGPAARQEGDRDLFVNKKNLFARMPLAGACRPPAGRQAPCRHSTGRQGACRPAGGRQAPPCCIKGFPSPLPPHLLPTTSREREGERRGEGGSCNGEALSDFGS